MFKKMSTLSVLSCFLLIFNYSTVFAKGGFSGGGGSRGFSSSSSAFKSAGAVQSKSAFASTPSTSFWKAPTTQTAKATPSTAIPSATSKVATAPRTGFGGVSVFDKKQATIIQQNKSIKAKEAFVADTNKYTGYKPQTYATRADLPKNVQANPLISNTRVKSTDNYSTFNTNKQNYYRSHNFEPKPYMYSNASYSGYDGMFFWMAMNNMSNMAMINTLYNHSDQEGFKQWKAEAEKQAETNSELKAQLATMNATLANMTGDKDPKHLPQDMPTDVAIANDALTVVDKDKVVFNMATGPDKGNYCRGGNLLKEAAKETIDVKLTNTAGTMENMSLFSAGKVDGFIGQKDGIDSYALSNRLLVNKIKSRWITLYKEPFLLIGNKKGSVKQIEDLNEDNTIYVGAVGSGAENTWKRLVIQNADRYKKVKYVNLDNEEAVKRVMQSPNDLLLVVSGLNSNFLSTVDKLAASNPLRLVSITDQKLLSIKNVDGEDLYSAVTIPKNVYPNLQKGWFFQHSTKTMAVDSVVVMSDSWVGTNGAEALEDLTAAITEMQPKIYAVTSGNL